MKQLLILIFLTLQISFAQNIKIEVRSDFPSQTPWVKKMLQQSTKQLNKMFLNENVQLPKRILVRIKKNTKLNGISANARRVDNSINFTSNVWQKDKYRIWIMIHELVNLLSSYYGSNGYPSDWWANGRSPFPEYVSVLIMQRIGFKSEAIWRKSVHKDKSDHKFYWTLHKKFGVKLFKNFFSLMKKHKIDLNRIGKKWPHPDKKRTLVTLSLLSMSGKINLAKVATYYKIGQKPKDWHKRHPEIKFKPYTISVKEIEDMVYKIRNNVPLHNSHF